MDIRTLDNTADRDQVARLFERAADYVTLETGQPPNSGTADDFFADRPPTVAAEDTQHFGIFEQDHLLGIVGVLFGYPDPTDHYIGMMLLAPAARGLGVGAKALSHVTSLARTRGARRQLIAVLEANPKGRAFWEREGFVFNKTFPAGEDGHIRHRLMRQI